MRKRQGIFEFMLPMLPTRSQALDYEGEMWLDDNLDNYDAEYDGDVTYNERPVRLAFAMVLFCTKGSFRMRINLKDYNVGANEILLVTPGSILDQADIPAASRIVLVGYAFNGMQAGGFGPITLAFMNDYKGQPWQLQLSQEEMDRLVNVYRLMREIVKDEQHRYRHEALMGCRHILGAYLANAMERKKQSDEGSRGLSRETVLFSDFMKLVHQHYAEHREVAFYAEKMCITPKYLSVVVAKASHRTPTDWIRDYVILDAKALILSGEHTVQQVSDMLHFANPSFFGKYFKEAVGCAPGKFASMLTLLLLLMVTAVKGQNFPVAVVSGQDSVKSVQAGLVASVSGNVQGLQLSGFTNMAAGTLHGLQLAGINNIASGVEKGIQLSSMLNVSSGYMRGLQVSYYNYADSLNGSQIGLVNVARAHPRGWQAGVLNITHDTIAHKLGLVNINPNTTIDYMFSGGSATKFNAAVRFRNRSTYNVLGFGSHFMGLDKKFSGALFYRIGQYFQLNTKWSVGGDIGYYHIETFQHHAEGAGKRLFSLQARLNADYRLSERVGAFVSVGYGDTRYYRHWHRYRSRPLAEAGLTLRYQRQKDGRACQVPKLGSDDETGDELMASGPGKRHPWWALAQVTGINAGVHLFDRCVLNADFAQTTMHTWRENFKDGFVWDNDQFSTNLFMHPYHGNLYFNSARSQGLTFWQSAPFAMAGSLEWEFLGEREPPALNDLIATTFGGICIGEVTNRISRILLNDRRRGWSRFWSEAAATVFNPMGGLKRIATGDAWRVRGSHYLYHDRQKLPVDFSLSFGNRYLADNGTLFRGESNPYVNLYLDYGDPVNERGHNAPYDYFNAEVTFGLSSNQPVVNRLHLAGRLWSMPMLARGGVRAEFGIYQHFDYLDSKPVKDGSRQTPYRISEAAAFGPGIIIQMPSTGSLQRLEQRMFLNGVLLGGTKSDYYSFIDRDYNMGSGYSVKSKTHLELRELGRLILHAQLYRIFTWKGYEQKDLTDIDPLHLNSQGDKGDAELVVLSPIVEIDLKNNWSLLLAGSYFGRKTHYKYYDDVSTKTFEVRAGLTCHF